MSNRTPWSLLAAATLSLATGLAGIAPAALAAEDAEAPAQTTTPSISTTVQTPDGPVDTTDYLMAHFVTADGTNPWEEQVYFSLSHDSREWTDLHSASLPVLTSTVSCGGIRDPFILRAHDGSKFWILATDRDQATADVPGCGWNVDGSRKIIIWESADLVNWSQPRAVDVASKIPTSAKNEGMTWAPEAVWDEDNQQYVVFWATASGVDDKDKRDTTPNQYYATTKDFVTFSDPVKWIDRKGYTLDSTMYKAEDGFWYRVHNSGIIERTKNLYATSFTEKNRKADENTQWKYLTQIQAALSVNNKQVEGNEFLITNKDDLDELGYKYAIVADQFKEEKGFGIVRTNNLASTTPADWHRDDKVDFHQDPAKGETIKKHGSFLNITADEYARITAAYAGDKWPVKFDSQGGSAVASATFKKGEKIAEPAAPTKDGYDFAGWTLDAEGTQPFDFTKAIDNPTGNIVLYAQWKQSAPAPEPETPAFTDVDASTPHSADIAWLAGQKIADGYPNADGKTYSFGGMRDVVRQDMASFLYKMAGSPAIDVDAALKTTKFTDVTKDTPHYQAVLWMEQAGLAKGFTDEATNTVTFGGDCTVVRQDMAAFLHRYAVDVAGVKDTAGVESFTDVTADTPHSADIAWASATKVAQGFGDGTFGGGRTVVRQDMAAFLHRLSALS